MDWQVLGFITKTWIIITSFSVFIQYKTRTNYIVSQIFDVLFSGNFFLLISVLCAC